MRGSHLVAMGQPVEMMVEVAILAAVLLDTLATFAGKKLMSAFLILVGIEEIAG